MSIFLVGNHEENKNDGENELVLCKHSYGVSMVSPEAASVLRDHEKGNSSIIKVGNQVTNDQPSTDDNESEWKCGCCEQLFDSAEELFQHLELLRQKSKFCLNSPEIVR